MLSHFAVSKMADLKCSARNVAHEQTRNRRSFRPHWVADVIFIPGCTCSIAELNKWNCKVAAGMEMSKPAIEVYIQRPIAPLSSPYPIPHY
jgi:hypothetical protein